MQVQKKTDSKSSTKHRERPVSFNDNNKIEKMGNLKVQDSHETWESLTTINMNTTPLDSHTEQHFFSDHGVGNLNLRNHSSKKRVDKEKRIVLTGFVELA